MSREDASSAPPPPTRRFTDAAQGHVSVLRANLTVMGELTGAEALELAGQFAGPISIEGLCHLHETARVFGPVTAGDAVIEGELVGALTVRGKVELRATAKVRGDITAHSVAMADGCHFEGHVHMEDESAGPPRSFQEKRRPR